MFYGFLNVTAHWTVINEGRNIVRLQNQNNYLAVVNGATVVMNFVSFNFRFNFIPVIIVKVTYNHSEAVCGKFLKM